MERFTWFFVACLSVIVTHLFPHTPQPHRLPSCQLAQSHEEVAGSEKGRETRLLSSKTSETTVWRLPILSTFLDMFLTECNWMSVSIIIVYVRHHKYLTTVSLFIIIHCWCWSIPCSTMDCVVMFIVHVEKKSWCSAILEWSFYRKICNSIISNRQRVEEMSVFILVSYLSFNSFLLIRSKLVPINISTNKNRSETLECCAVTHLSH